MAGGLSGDGVTRKIIPYERAAGKLYANRMLWLRLGFAHGRTRKEEEEAGQLGSPRPKTGAQPAIWRLGTGSEQPSASVYWEFFRHYPHHQTRWRANLSGRNDATFLICYKLHNE